MGPAGRQGNCVVTHRVTVGLPRRVTVWSPLTTSNPLHNHYTLAVVCSVTAHARDTASATSHNPGRTL